MLGNFSFFVVCRYFSTLLFSNISIRNNIGVNSLDPDQARHSVCPDLGPNCSQKIISRRKKSLRAGRVNKNQMRLFLTHLGPASITMLSALLKFSEKFIKRCFVSQNRKLKFQCSFKITFFILVTLTCTLTNMEDPHEMLHFFLVYTVCR